MEINFVIKKHVVYIGANSGTLDGSDGEPANGGDGTGDDVEITPTEPEGSTEEPEDSDQERVFFLSNCIVLIQSPFNPTIDAI